MIGTDVFRRWTTTSNGQRRNKKLKFIRLSLRITLTMRVLISIVIALLFESTTAFSPSSRRAFFDGAVSSVLVGTAAVAPAWAVDDLAMPTPEEQKAMDVSYSYDNDDEAPVSTLASHHSSIL